MISEDVSRALRIPTVSIIPVRIPPPIACAYKSGKISFSLSDQKASLRMWSRNNLLSHALFRITTTIFRMWSRICSTPSSLQWNRQNNGLEWQRFQWPRSEGVTIVSEAEHEGVQNQGECLELNSNCRLEPHRLKLLT